MRIPLEPHPIATLTGPASGSELETAFANRFDSWSGADQMAPLSLSDGSLWFFGGDTWVGGVTENLEPANGMTRNSIVSLRGAELTAWFGPDRSTPLQASKPDMWLWPLAAVIGRWGIVRVLSSRIRRDASAWAWGIDGFDVNVLRLGEMSISPGTEAPTFQWGAIKWGSALKVGSVIYVYGFLYAQPLGSQVLARTTLSGIDRMPWEYWTGGGWSTDADLIAPIEVAERPLAHVWVIQRHGMFYASSHLVDGFDFEEIRVWRSASPEGPFTPLGTVATLPVPEGWMSYAGRVFQIGPDGPLVAMHSLNRVPGSGTSYNVPQFGPHFVDVDPALLY